MTVPLIPQYLTGRLYTSVLVSPVTVAADGSWTYADGKDLAVTSVLDECSIEPELDSTDISSINVTMKNYVPIKDDFTVSIGEIIADGGVSICEQIWAGYNYFRVSFTTEDESDDTFHFACVCTRGTLRRGIVQEKNGVIMTGKPCGVAPYWGTSTPPY